MLKKLCFALALSLGTIAAFSLPDDGEGDGGLRYTVFPCTVWTSEGYKDGAACSMPLSTGECTRTTECILR